MRRIRTLIALFVFLAVGGCSGETKPVPVPAASPAGPAVGNLPPSPPPAAEVLHHPETKGGNSPPEIRRIRFLPADRMTGSPLGVEAEGYDPDGDEVRFEIAWRKNGEPAGDGNRLQVPVRRGDKVSVTVVPFDGESRGRGASLSREIVNQVFIEGKEHFSVSESVVTFRVLASDDAGAPLAYSLRSAPPGMRIDPVTGWVRWETAPGTQGRIPFDVVVSDGAGAEATARFTVTIQEESPSGGR